MGWLRDVVLGDRRCHRCGRAEAGCVCRRSPSRAVTNRQPRARNRRAQNQDKPGRFGR